MPEEAAFKNLLSGVCWLWPACIIQNYLNLFPTHVGYNILMWAYIPYQSADVPLAVPLDLGDLLLVLLVLHSQVTSLHLVCLDHIAESLVCLFLSCLQLSYLLQELHPLLVKEAPRLLLGFQSERSAHLQGWHGSGGVGLLIIKTD